MTIKSNKIVTAQQGTQNDTVQMAKITAIITVRNLNSVAPAAPVALTANIYIQNKTLIKN